MSNCSKQQAMFTVPLRIQDVDSWISHGRLTVFWATVCKTVRPMLSDRCPVCLIVLSCLSVTFVHCTVDKRLDGSRRNLACR